MSSRAHSSLRSSGQAARGICLTVLGAAIVLAIACADSAKNASTTRADSSKTVPVQGVAAVDSMARQNTNFEAARTPAVLTREMFQFDSAMVDSAQTYALSLDELRLLRGLVFGRHGRRFADDAFIQSYLESQPWYKPDSTFNNTRLNDMERANLDIIRGAEASKHDRIMPGDVRYYRGRTITSAMLGHHTPVEWRLLSSEVLAMNGHEFNDIPSADDMDFMEFGADSSESLQIYYRNRYWYRPLRPLRFSDLPADDRALADTIELARIRDLDAHVSFGMMRLFQHTPLTEKNLEYTSLMGLRLMRNEVYALHGRDFSTPWIKRMLAAAGYQPTGTFRESDLTEVERANVALIRRVEDRKHEELSTADLDGRNFIGMPLAFVRLLRNEIFARHGRVFKDKALQAYFSAMPWYKPNPAFTESMLTPRELANAAILKKHEELIASGGSYPEG